MRLQVPFIPNSMNDCGPLCVQMALAFFDDDRPFEAVKQLTMPDRSGITYTVGLARAAAKLGHRVELYSMKLGFNPAAFDNEFYRQRGDGLEDTQRKIEQGMQECRELGVHMEERSLSREEIISRLSDDCVAIALFDWAVIRGREGFHGHFMVIVGEEGDDVLLHQPGPKDPTPFFALPRHLFDEARRSPGTDQDIIFIHRKKA